MRIPGCRGAGRALSECVSLFPRFLHSKLNAKIEFRSFSNDTKAINTILFRMQIVGACTWALYLGAAGVAVWMAFQPPSFIQGLFATNKPL